MLLKQIVCDKTNLTLIKEKKEVKYNETFEVSKERASEILSATYLGKPVAEIANTNNVDSKNPKNIQKK